MSRIVLVTGASRGIGLSVAQHLAAAGHMPLLGIRNLAAVLDMAENGPKLHCVQMDVTSDASVNAAVEEVRGSYGRLDGLVNNAAVFFGHDALAFPADAAHTLLETNFLGPWRVTIAFLDLLRASPCASIVNVSSTTGSIGLTADGERIPGKVEPRLGYCCTKAALNMLTVQLQKAFARTPGHDHIKINAVSPGYTATAMNDFTGDKPVAGAAQTIAAFATLGPEGPTGKFLDEHGEIPW